ncbi:glycosyltransferase [Kocuria sp. JC486]|uniref:heparinase II/III domain-containing protein n=1 Tax=Kocuria sp. JC486 TaxID=1970736 RepID=UPI0014212BD2|nr:heparinase II/III family protein [Kocuria sp. JC486]NHU84260.1 glycosyltransferase [Kocuria sp. JC486]
MTDTDSGTIQDLLQRYDVNEDVCTRQCVGAGFERRDNNDDRAAKVMSGSLQLAPHAVWKTDGYDDWSADPFGSHNWQFQFHALRWLSPVRHSATDGSEEARQFWLATVRSWIEHNHPDAPASQFSWVDMADGLRAQELVFGWPLAKTDEERGVLLGALETHGEWLADEEHQSRANHALHQNIGLFVLSSFLRHDKWRDLSIGRSARLFEVSFDENGANDEGSIDYHRMNISWWQKTWDRVAQEGGRVPESVAAQLAQAATFLAHATRPDGTMVPIGDTHLREVTDMGFPELEYVASQGTAGMPPAATAVAASNGYVMGRSGWGEQDGSFAEHSHYSLRFGRAYSAHHHEDRGGLTFFANGFDWITDPGSYMYEPKDPFRRYLRSRAGHNLVVIDGKDYDREGHVTLQSVDFTDTVHDMTVVDSNYDGVQLTRRIVYLPPLDLMVVTDVFDSTDEVVARQLWHTDSGVKPRYRDQALELQTADGRRFTVNWLAGGARPKVSYAEDGRPENWVSRRWGKKNKAAGFHVEQKARRGFFTTVLGESTQDPWSVVSSRVKADTAWLRVQRAGQIWGITIDQDGVTVEQDPVYKGVEVPEIKSDFEAAVLRTRLDALEQRLALVSARQAEATAVENRGVEDVEQKLASTSKKVKQLAKVHQDDLERELKLVAAILPLLPPDVPRRTILGGADFAQYLPYIQDPLYVYEQWRHKTDAIPLTLTQRRRLAKDLYSRGYWLRSLEVLNSVLTVAGSDKDRRTIEIRASEIAMMRGEITLSCEPPESFEPVAGRVLHVVGKAIPETQTGYTLRTHYLAQAQVQKGYDVHAFRQAGGVPEAVEEPEVLLDGVTYHLPEGQPRGTLPWDEWLELNVRELAELVARVRPSVLHCHSDFVNHMIAHPVAQAFGLPVVYESRGFWEESWLSRIETKSGRDLTRDYDRYGLPEAYTLRRAREDAARALSDRVTTLAEVMKDHIVERGEEAAKVSVTPNGVQPDEFPVIEPDLTLKAELGIPPEAPVIGYITSVVEYEGIDTLLTAFRTVLQKQPETWLLLVGDGPVRSSLEHLAKNLGVADRVIFTGRVPHESVLDYYSLIDLFVVPRKDRTVCRLVTPLKPFEAFSTGRAVVVSDVDALREIADQSGAAATFTAGDPADLAQVLNELLNDPERRLAMSVKGAEWVRQARSWAAIADLYDAPYENVGFLPFRPADDPLSEPYDALALRNDLRNLSRHEALRYLTVHTGQPQYDPVRTADEIIADGWSNHGFPAIAIPEDFDWLQVEELDRTLQMYLHSWEFLTPVLEAWEETGSAHYLEWAVQRALQWATYFPVIDPSTMAWYDMALAYRSVVLQGLIRAVAGSSAVSDSDFNTLVESTLRQRDAHWRPDSFNPRNNHGYYSAVSQVVLSRAFPQLPGMKALKAQGDSRLRIMTATQFLSDGGHAEHSPEYHRMLLNSFEGAISLGAVQDPEVASRIGKAADALGWMILPQGQLLQLGDSAQGRLDATDTSSSATTDWVLSKGARGVAPTDDALVLPETGYAIVRRLNADEQEGRNASYLAVTAGFHSRTHKHCDDQSLVWFEDGQEILVDGGRYRYGDLLPQDSPLRSNGFYYSDPIRQYMESCAAHSTVSVDSRLHDRRRAPYGSGLVSFDRLDDGGYRIVTAVPHDGWESERTVTYHPGRRLVIEDHVVTQDDERHTLHSWFLLDGGLEITDEQGMQGEDAQGKALGIRSMKWGGPLHLKRISGLDEELTVRTNRIGDTWEEVEGVRSREDRRTEPAWSVRWTGEFQGEARTRTEFVFESEEGHQNPAQVSYDQNPSLTDDTRPDLGSSDV